MCSLSRPRLIGLHDMDWPDYLRDEAAKYRQLAEQTDDPVVKNEMLELASVCDEVANNIEDHLTGGELVAHTPLECEGGHFRKTDQRRMKIPPTAAAIIWDASRQGLPELDGYRARHARFQRWRGRRKPRKGLPPMPITPEMRRAHNSRRSD